MIKKPVTWIVVGFVLVLLGFVLPWLMVLKILQSTLLLNFVSFSATVSGLFLGLAGAAWHVRLEKTR